MASIYEARRPGLMYYTSLLLQMYAPALIYAAENPGTPCKRGIGFRARPVLTKRVPVATLSDLYREKKSPELQTPKLMIDFTYEFHPLFRHAITQCKVLSPAEKLIKKAIYGTKVSGGGTARFLKPESNAVGAHRYRGYVISIRTHSR